MKEKIQDLFNTLHDGVIVSWNGDKNQLNLKIECQYLAERFDPTYNHFHVQLFQIERHTLEPWMKDFIPQENIVSLEEIFKAQLEIKSSEIKDDVVIIYCSQSDPVYDFCGGNLFIKCRDIKLFDQQNHEITLDELKVISMQYWDDFNNN